LIETSSAEVGSSQIHQTGPQGQRACNTDALPLSSEKLCG